MSVTVMLFVCLLSNGSVLYQDVPCAEAPDWALSGHVVVQQRVIHSVLPPASKEAAERSRAEIARGDAASERARADIQASLNRQHELAIIREQGFWYWKALSDRRPDSVDVNVSTSQGQAQSSNQRAAVNGLKAVVK
jgi:hypothetical protein